MTVFRPRGSKLYVYKFMIQGQLYRGPTGKSNERDAKAVERVHRAEVKKRLLLVSSDGSSDLTVAQATLKYMTWREAQPNANARLLRCYTKDYANLVNRLGKNTLMSSIGTPDLQQKVIEPRTQEFKRNQKGEVVLRRDPVTGAQVPQKLSGATINRTTWQLFKPIYMKARDTWGVQMKPIDWKRLRVKETGERKREVKIDEEMRFEQFFKDGYGDMFKFHLASGLRKSNCINLLWSQVDLLAGEIQVVQKGNKVHTIRIDDAMRAILNNQRHKDQTRVFTYTAQRSYMNKRAGIEFKAGQRYPLTSRGFSAWFERVRVKIGAADLRIHDLRRSAGGRLLRATNNLKAVQVLLGHSDISTTARHYAHVLSEDQVALQNKRTDWERMMREAALTDGGARDREIAGAARIGQVFGQDGNETANNAVKTAA